MSFDFTNTLSGNSTTSQAPNHCLAASQLYTSHIGNPRVHVSLVSAHSPHTHHSKHPTLKPHYKYHCFCQADADNLYTKTAEPSTDTPVDYFLPPNQLWNDRWGQQPPLLSSHRTPELCGRRHLAWYKSLQVIWHQTYRFCGEIAWSSPRIDAKSDRYKSVQLFA